MWNQEKINCLLTTAHEISFQTQPSHPYSLGTNYIVTLHQFAKALSSNSQYYLGQNKGFSMNIIHSCQCFLIGLGWHAKSVFALKKTPEVRYCPYAQVGEGATAQLWLITTNISCHMTGLFSLTICIFIVPQLLSFAEIYLKFT